jgi:hypothetical protein
MALRDRKIVEQQAGVDMMELMQQIGAIPAETHASASSTTRS